MKKRHRIPFTTWSLKHLGKPYRLGENDCLTLVMDFCKSAGVDVPDEFEGIRKDAYAEFYQRDPAAAHETFIRWVANIGDEINPSHAFTGDVLVMRPKGSTESKWPSVAIHAGGDRIIGAYADRRCRVELGPLRGYEVIKAYRIRMERQWR